MGTGVIERSQFETGASVKSKMGVDASTRVRIQSRIDPRIESKVAASMQDGRRKTERGRQLMHIDDAPTSVSP
jgi:hypothetical protein